jgi:hypothetical protein
MRLSRRAAPGPDAVDANRTHPYVDTNDPGLGAGFAGGGSGFSGSQVSMLAVTTGFMRATRCAVPGCGKPRQDVIHGAPED